MNTLEARKNFKYCAETHKLKVRSEINLIELGGRLMRIWKHEMFKPNYDSFQDYLEDLKISKASASKLISVYEKFVLRLKFRIKELAEYGGAYSISEVMALVESKREAKEWLNKVKILNRLDLRREIMEKKTGVLIAKCSHKNFEILKIKICNDCGDRQRMYD